NTGVGIAYHNETAHAIHNSSFGGIVEIGMEHRKTVPAAMPWWPDRVPHASLNCQVLRGLPTVLQEPVKRCCDPGRDRFPTELRILIELAENSVGDGDSSRVRPARIEESEQTVLVHCRRCRCGRELNMVILSGVFNEYAPFDRMVCNDLRCVVRPRVHESSPRARVRALLHVAKVLNENRRKFLIKPLCSREKVRIVNAVGSSLALCATSRVSQD